MGSIIHRLNRDHSSQAVMRTDSECLGPVAVLVVWWFQSSLRLEKIPNKTRYMSVVESLSSSTVLKSLDLFPTWPRPLTRLLHPAKKTPSPPSSSPTRSRDGTGPLPRSSAWKGPAPRDDPQSPWPPENRRDYRDSSDRLCFFFTKQ